MITFSKIATLNPIVKNEFLKALFNICNSLMTKSLITSAFVICSFAAVAQNSYSQKLYAYKELHFRTKTFTNDTARADLTSSYNNYLIYIELPQRDTPIWHT